MGWRTRIPVLAAALWWGSLSAIGFVAVPLLFIHLPSPALAGQTAARLFSAQTGVSVACGALILLAARGRDDTARLDWGQGVLGFVLAGVLFALLSEYGVAPRIVARENLAFWHSAGTALYALQWVCAMVSLWKLTSGQRMSSRA